MVQFSSFLDLDRKFCNCFTSKAYPRKFPTSHENFLISFLKGISWDICFKLLPSSPKPLFSCFYIKTQLNSSFFHSINISKVIFNSFHWFWSLDYVFGGFYVHSWVFLKWGLENLMFCQSFLLGFVLNDDLLWILVPCGKNNMYLDNIFIYSCIV